MCVTVNEEDVNAQSSSSSDDSVAIIIFSYDESFQIPGDYSLAYFAPELFTAESRVFNESTLMYSFAVMMNEVLTGTPPLQQYLANELIALQLKSGGRSRPELLSITDYYGNAAICNVLSSIIDLCWNVHADFRPTFKELNSILEFFVPDGLLKLRHANVAILGSAGAGKTSLVRAIAGQEFNNWEDLRTRMLDIREFEFDGKSSSVVQKKNDLHIAVQEMTTILKGVVNDSTVLASIANSYNIDLKDNLDIPEVTLMRKFNDTIDNKISVRFLDVGGDNGYQEMRETVFNGDYLLVSLSIIVFNYNTSVKISEYLDKWILRNKCPTLVVVTHAREILNNAQEKLRISDECRSFFRSKKMSYLDPVFVELGPNPENVDNLRSCVLDFVDNQPLLKVTAAQHFSISIAMVAVTEFGFKLLNFVSPKLRYFYAVTNREADYVVLSSHMFTELVRFAQNPIGFVEYAISSCRNEFRKQGDALGELEQELTERMIPGVHTTSPEKLEFNKNLYVKTLGIKSDMCSCKKKIEKLEGALAVAVNHVRPFCGLEVFTNQNRSVAEDVAEAEIDIVKILLGCFWNEELLDIGVDVVKDLRRALISTHLSNRVQAISVPFTKSCKDDFYESEMPLRNLSEAPLDVGSCKRKSDHQNIHGDDKRQKVSVGSDLVNTPNMGSYTDSSSSDASSSVVPSLAVDQVDRAYSKLLMAIQRRKLSDLHTHLTGMGSHEFWVEKIMCHLIPTMVSRVENECGVSSTDRFHRLLMEISRRIVCDSSDHNQVDIECKHLRNQWNANFKEESKSLLTIDVVYSKSILLLSLLGYDKGMDEMSHDPEENDHISSLEKYLSNSVLPTMEFEKHFKEYIVYDIKELKFVRVFGLTNSFIVEAMEWKKRSSQRSERAKAIIAKIRNCFSMLNVDGSDPRTADLDGFRGNFTPYFYPMRYALKDPMYQQVPFVLSYLINHVCSRYAMCGVGYVEFSLGIGDLHHNVLHKFLYPDIAFKGTNDFSQLCWDWNSTLECLVDYKFLIGVSRTKTIFGCKPRSIRRCFVSLYGPLYVRMMRNRRLHFDGSDEVDRFLEAIYCYEKPDNANKVSIHQFTRDVNVKLLEIFCRYEKNPDKQLCVGMDFNGEEDGNPFCLFLHSSILKTIDQFRSQNKKFGVRFHAGEAVVRGSSVRHDPSRDETVLNFYTHLQVVAEEIMYLAKRMDETFDHDSCAPVDIRIGHGLAFLPVTSKYHDVDLSAVNVAENYYSLLKTSLLYSLVSVDDACFHGCRPGWIGLHSTLVEFRQWLVRHKVVFEVNLTSNHTLLSDVFCTEIGEKSEMYVQSMLHNNFNVILSTDDDGIWPILQCTRHRCHISVAKEYCKALGMLTREFVVKWDEFKRKLELLRGENYVFNDLVWRKLRKTLAKIFEENHVDKWNFCLVRINEFTQLEIGKDIFLSDLVPLLVPSPDWKSIDRLLAPLENDEACQHWFSEKSIRK